MFVVISFFVWRICLFVPAYLSTIYLPLQHNFLGGGLGNYLQMPLFWGWANFDGEHYLSIAQSGFGLGEQAFFPLYPLFIKFLSGRSLFSLNLWGQIISNISFLVALFGFYKLMRLDFSEKISRLAVILMLIFPTSFYFAAVYTESLFLALVVWSFYLARKDKWLPASLLGMFASGTRVIGIILLPVLLVEYFVQKRKLVPSAYSLFTLLLIPLGLFAYMFFLYRITGDAFKFIHALPTFGEQRSSALILLPRVFYRYIFKILPNINYSYFAGTFTTVMEFIVGLLFLFMSVYSFFKLRLSYALFLSLGYLIPTFSGSFSSLPRYVLILFPVYIILAIWLQTKPIVAKSLVFTVLLLLLIISLSMFFRGYWLS
jgi:Gpi18-like mannosyltransferase